MSQPTPDGTGGLSPEQLDRIGRATLRRTLRDRDSVLVTSGDFRDLFAAWEQHAALWGTAADGLSTVLMRQGLAAAALHLANRPRDEMVAWTLNLRTPPTNLFLTGEARAGTVTGRVYTEGVRTADSSRLYVQTLRARGEPTVSAIEVTGLDVMEIFEQYYERSEQRPARFFELEEYRFAMVLAMPGADPQWLASLGREDPAVRDGAGDRVLEEREFRLECGCTPRKMISALRGIFANDPEDLFRGDPMVETTCPRCGRRWWVSREQFAAGDMGGEGS